MHGYDVNVDVSKFDKFSKWITCEINLCFLGVKDRKNINILNSVKFYFISFITTQHQDTQYNISNAQDI